MAMNSLPLEILKTRCPKKDLLGNGLTKVIRLGDLYTSFSKLNCSAIIQLLQSTSQNDGIKTDTHKLSSIYISLWHYLHPLSTLGPEMGVPVFEEKNQHAVEVPQVLLWEKH